MSFIIVHYTNLCLLIFILVNQSLYGVNQAVCRKGDHDDNSSQVWLCV